MRLQRFGDRARAAAPTFRRRAVAPRTTSTGNPRCSSAIAHPLVPRMRRAASDAPSRPAASAQRAAASVEQPRTATSRSMPVKLRQIHQDPDDAVHLPAQPERIARPGRPLAGARQTDERVELVGQRHGRPRRPPRRRAARATAAHRLRRRSAGTGSRSPSRPSSGWPSSRA